MRRASLVLAVTAVASVASARVVMAPTIPRVCPSGKTWEQVDKCIARFGRVTVERELPGAKLIKLSASGGGFRVPGLYLYAQHGESWKLAGMYEESGNLVILGLQRVTLAKHTGYRFDLGLTEPATSDVDSELARPAVLQAKYAVFCSGIGARCTGILTSCDLLVEGRSAASFRSTLTFDGDTVKVAGDRTRVSTFCGSPEMQPLGWSGIDEIDF